MKLRILYIFLSCLICQNVYAQNTFSGTVLALENDKPLSDVEIHDFYDGFITKTNKDGDFRFTNKKKATKLVFYKQDYNYKVVDWKSSTNQKIHLKLYSVDLNEVIIVDQENRFINTQLDDIVGNSIFAGKKTNKIIIENTAGDLAANNARHIYNRIGGLNIFQNDDAGLQLNIGSRGLNPARSANFNIRQNGYDISADVLGYPESYYTPTAESLKEIQVVRGAASLQYGTQFGGLINFVLKKPTTKNKFQILTRNTIGNNSLFTNFTSISKKHKKFSYYSFYNYKNGDGFRPNSSYESINLYSYLEYKFSELTTLSFEVTYLKYLAQQAGGLTDKMFDEEILQSNRERNWFKIDWLLYNAKLSFKLNQNDNISLSLFALDANRFSLGYRNIRVDQVDPLNERDLIKGFFNNYGFESRYLNKYKFLNKKAVLLTGIKYYVSDNISEQGPGSTSYGSDFDFAYNDYPYYTNTSLYNYPNLNTAYFLENVFYINSNLSITPGLRYEYIDTKSDGYYRSVNLNLVDQPIYDTTIYNRSRNTRDFVLFGVGLSYKNKKEYEIYSNISQNYRSVTFSDITITSPTFLIDPNIIDESGYSFDVGLRGIYNSFLRFDLNYFGLSYNNRIGFLQKKVEFMPGFFTTKTQKGNIGDAFINGFESLIDLSFKNVLKDLNLGGFINYAHTISEYLRSGSKFIIGNKVEFVPEHNIKFGLSFNYKRFMASLQSTYLSDQFTDASNSSESDISGILGRIPSYHILDFSSSINFRNTKLFFGINNLLNNKYFTRRATGYPGPGIIPSPLRNYYLTLELKI